MLMHGKHNIFTRSEQNIQKTLQGNALFFLTTPLKNRQKKTQDKCLGF